MTEKTSESIQEKNSEILRELEDSNEKVIIKEVDGKQRLYVEFGDDLYLAFEVTVINENGLTDTHCSQLAVNSEGDELDISDFPDIKITEDDLRPVKGKIRDFFINFCFNMKTMELDGKVITQKDMEKLKALQVVISTQKYDIKDILELTKDYIEKLSSNLGEDAKFGINNKALTGITGFIPSLISSSTSTRVKNDNSDTNVNVHKLISEITLMENVSDTLKGIVLTTLRDKYKNSYKSFFESSEYNGLSLESRVLPILILARDINDKEMYNECVTELSDTLIKVKEENESISKIADNYVSMAFDMLNSGNKSNMQIGSMLNPLRPLINCIGKADDFFTYCDCISKNIPNFNTIEANNEPISSEKIIDIYAKTNMINELNNSNKLNEIFKGTDDQKRIIGSFFKSFNDTIINHKLDGGFLLEQFEEAIGILYKLNPEIFLECKNTIEANIKGAPIQKSFIKKYKERLAKLNTNELIQETAKIDIIDDMLLSENKYTYICEELFKKREKELKEMKDENISNLLANLLCNGRIEEDTTQEYFEGIKKYGFKVTNIVELAIENISKREDIYPFVKKALVTSLYLTYDKYERSKNASPSKNIKDKVITGDYSTKTKDKNGKYVTFTTNDKDLIELFFSQQQEAIETLKARVIKQDLIRPEIDKIEKNKAIFKKIKETIPCFEFYNSKDKDSINKAGSTLAGLLYDGNNNKEALEKYFNNFEKLGFPIGEVVISATKSINEDKEIYPFVRKAIIDNLSAMYMTTDYSDKQQDKTKEMIELTKIKGEINNETPVKVKDKTGKAISLDLKSELLNSFFNQEKISIDNLAKQASQKDEAKKQESILEKNKTIIQKLRENQNSCELFVRGNGIARGGLV